MFKDIHSTAQRNFSKFEGVGCQKPRENVTLAIMIAKRHQFFPLCHREILFSLHDVHEGLYLGCKVIRFEALNNVLKFGSVEAKKTLKKVYFRNQIVKVVSFFPL